MKVLIIGGGKFGYTLAKLFVYEGIDVTLMDNDIKVLDRINEQLDILTIHGNGLDYKELKTAKIDVFDFIVVSTTFDETNTIIASLAKKLACKTTIVRIREPAFMEQINFVKVEMGIDYIINPDLATAKSIEKYLLNHFSYQSDDFADGKVTLVDYNISHFNEVVGKKLKDLDVFQNLLIAAISRNGNILIPHGETDLHKDDIIHVLGKTIDINTLNSKLDKPTSKDLKNVVILGGSNIGYYLSKGLKKANISITIIERDLNRCKDLSEKLSDVLIIHGDGTDIHLLEEEGLLSTDAFISVTGLDELNLLMTLVADQYGVRKTIAKISRQNYSKVIDRLGIIVSVNPIYIAASAILRLIRGGKVVSVSLILGGEAEVTELIIDKNLNIIGKPLKDLNLPKGIIIGAIIQKNKVTIPNGNSIIMADDRIIVFSLSRDLPALKLFFRNDKGGIISELWSRRKGSRNNSSN